MHNKYLLYVWLQRTKDMTYLKDKYNKMYNEYVGIDAASVGNIKSIVKKVDNMKDLVSRLKKAIRGDNLKNDTSRFGRIFQKGDNVDLALEAQERIRVCKGANASNIREGFDTKDIKRVETVGNTGKYLKMYQDMLKKVQKEIWNYVLPKVMHILLL